MWDIYIGMWFLRNLVWDRVKRIRIGVIFQKTDHLVEDKGSREMTFSKSYITATQLNRKENVDLSNFWKIAFLREGEAKKNPADLR